MSDILSADIEWLDGGDLIDRVHATYARLVLRFDGAAVTRVRDARTRSDRDSIHVSIYPLAEWLAQNWFSLRLEGENRWRDGRAFARRHHLPSALDGFYFPSLQVTAEGDCVRLRWSPRGPLISGIEFIEGGSLTCARETFDAFATDLIERVVARLRDLDLKGTALEEEWTAIRSLSSAELRFAGAAARLGADPFDMREADLDHIERVVESLPDELHDDVLSLVTPDDFDRQLAWFTAATAMLKDRAGSDGLRHLRNSLRQALVQAGASLPHERGAQAAERLRDTFDLGLAPIGGLPHLRALFQIGEEDAVVFDQRTDRRVDVLTHVGLGERPAFLITKTRSDSRMFALGRGIYDFLRDDGRVWNLVTGLRTPRGQESRAFAAHFLCPPQAIRQIIQEEGLNAVDDDTLSEISDMFHVSTLVVRNHIDNYGLIPVMN